MRDDERRTACVEDQIADEIWRHIRSSVFWVVLTEDEKVGVTGMELCCPLYDGHVSIH